MFKDSVLMLMNAVKVILDYCKLHKKGHFLISAVLDNEDSPALVEVSSCKMPSNEDTFSCSTGHHRTIYVLLTYKSESRQRNRTMVFQLCIAVLVPGINKHATSSGGKCYPCIAKIMSMVCAQPWYTSLTKR